MSFLSHINSLRYDSYQMTKRIGAPSLDSSWVKEVSAFSSRVDPKKPEYPSRFRVDETHMIRTW